MRADFLETLRFWCDHGVDGFRIDVAHGLAKDLDRDDLDDYVVMSTNDMPADGSHPVLDRDEVHDIYREWRREVFNRYDPPRFAVAEAWVRPERQYLYASPDELGQVFNFEFAKADWTFDAMSKAIDEGLACAERSGSTSTWVMSNHDVPRHATRYALPQVPTGEYHQIANDWLLRDGTTYIEDRQAGALRARAALMLEMALPARPTCIRARSWACSRWRIFHGTASRIPPACAPRGRSPPRAVTAAACRCPGSRPTCPRRTRPTRGTSMPARSGSPLPSVTPNHTSRSPRGSRISPWTSRTPTTAPC